MIINMVGGGGGFSPSNAIVGVTAYAGSTVTISNGTVTKVVTPDKSHVLSDLPSFAIYYFGIPSGMFSPSVVWNIVATYQTKQTIASVVINTNAFYDIVLTYKIPYDYQEVEYLESDGNQYIDTLIKTDNIGVLNCKFIKFQDDPVSFPRYFFGGTQGLKSNDTYLPSGFGINSQSTQLGLYLSIDPLSLYYLRINYSQMGDFTLSFLSGNSYYSIQNITDGTTRTENLASGFQISFNGNLYIFTMHFSDGVNLTNHNRSRFYNFDMFNYQNEKISSLVPCYRKSDSVSGMYDNVNNRFLTNQGTGTFIVGSDVTE